MLVELGDGSRMDAAGVLRRYKDVTGREQRAVDGPNGTWLITSKNDREPFEVWKSDSLKTLIRTENLGVAIDRAMHAAGVSL